MSYLFPPSRPLLYPQFETYHLRPLDPSSDVVSFPLPGPGATQSRVGYNQHHLSFKEIRARITWDHLAVGEGGRGVYVDADWAVVGFELGADLRPTFSQLASLPVPISSTEASQQLEYPSVVALSSTRWAVSSGSGSLYILQTSAPGAEAFTGELTARYDLSLAGRSEAVPFLIQAIHAASVNDVRLLLTRSVRSNRGKRKAQETTFELIEISLDPAHRTDVDGASPPSPVVKWVLQGNDLPFWCGWSGGGWLVLSGESYGHSAGEAMEVEETPAETEKREREEKLAKLGLGATLPAGEQVELDPKTKPEAVLETDEKIWPFSWTQNADSVSVTISFPDGTARSDISIGLTPTVLTINLKAERLAEASPQLVEFLRIPTRTFWTEIDISSTSYTFDPKKYTLELCIAKIEENNRWPAVFLPEDDDEEEVPETLSASLLATVRETFNNIKTRSAEEPEGKHPAIPALLREEMEFDLEDGEDYGDYAENILTDSGGGKVGREVFIGYVAEGHPSWSKQSSSVLSTPIRPDGASPINPHVMVKSAVDGLLFAPESGVDPAVTPWTHVSTSPALAFVISSKRDLRIVRHFVPAAIVESPASPRRTKTEDSAKTTVLAFDAGSSSAGQGNVYVYYPPTSKTTAQQGVIRVSGGERGALLGVGCVRLGDKEVLVALCEKELVVLKSVL